MKTRKSPDLRIPTICLVQNVDGSIGIDAYPATPEGEAAALAHFHKIVLETSKDAGEDADSYDSLAEVQEAFATVEDANYFDGDDYDVMIVRSET